MSQYRANADRHATLAVLDDGAIMCQETPAGRITYALEFLADRYLFSLVSCMILSKALPSVIRRRAGDCQTRVQGLCPSLARAPNRALATTRAPNFGRREVDQGCVGKRLAGHCYVFA
jgi:hypothetical protein